MNLDYMVPYVLLGFALAVATGCVSGPVSPT